MQIPVGQQQRPSAGREWYKQRGGGVTFKAGLPAPWGLTCVPVKQGVCVMYAGRM